MNNECSISVIEHINLSKDRVDMELVALGDNQFHTCLIIGPCEGLS